MPAHRRVHHFYADNLFRDPREVAQTLERNMNMQIGASEKIVSVLHNPQHSSVVIVITDDYGLGPVK